MIRRKWPSAFSHSLGRKWTFPSNLIRA